MKNAEDLKIIPENIKSEEIKTAYSISEQFGWSEGEIELYEARDRAVAAQKDKMNTAKEDGLEEGRKEGKKEGMLEGKKEGRKEGRKEGIKEGKKEGKKEGVLEGIDLALKKMIISGMEENQAKKTLNIN